MSLGEAFEGLQTYDLLLFILGVGLLGISTLPRLLHDKPLTVPILMVGLGMIAGRCRWDWTCRIRSGSTRH